LIDHVLSNSGNLEICSGTLVSDDSDHFFTFILPHICPNPKQMHHTISSRDFSNTNLNGFKRELSLINWNYVLQKTNVDEAYEAFWSLHGTVSSKPLIIPIGLFRIFSKQGEPPVLLIQVANGKNLQSEKSSIFLLDTFG
jgi:hypothetical protein